MPYTSWDSTENIIRSLTRLLENRRGNIKDAPVTFKAALAALNKELENWQPTGKVCIGCEQPKGQPHLDWCPVVTGTLSSLDRRPK